MALTTFFREVVHVPPPHEIDFLRSEPSWAGPVAAAHTIPREFADADYVLEPQLFARLMTPTLLLVGGNSPRFLKAGTEALHRALPHSRIVVMPGQQHAAMSTAPELFAREVIAFLTELP